MKHLLLLLSGLVLIGAEVRPDTFMLNELPYSYNALAPFIDAETLEIHYDRHHRGYVYNLNQEVNDYPQLTSMTLEQIMERVSKFNTAVRTAAGGHYNHRLLWQLMAPPESAGRPSPALQRALTEKFGSLADLQKAFAEAAGTHFGSGWVWLIINPSGELQVTATPDHDNPLMDDVPERGAPILALDLWEHAYYLQYGTKRADYLAAWWNVVNWNEVNRLYEAAIQ
jgi:Fe-Mn family superoxide dismutase